MCMNSLKMNKKNKHVYATPTLRTGNMPGNSRCPSPKHTPPSRPQQPSELKDVGPHYSLFYTDKNVEA